MSEGGDSCDPGCGVHDSAIGARARSSWPLLGSAVGAGEAAAADRWSGDLCALQGRFVWQHRRRRAGPFLVPRGALVGRRLLVGSWGLEFVAQPQCQLPNPVGYCNLRFAGASVRHNAFSRGLADFPLIEVPIGGEIGGTCSGVIIYPSELARLTCSFNTASGLSGTRQLLVATVEDVDKVPCGFLCEHSEVSTSHTGVYGPGNLGQEIG